MFTYCKNKRENKKERNKVLYSSGPLSKLLGFIGGL